MCELSDMFVLHIVNTDKSVLRKNRKKTLKNGKLSSIRNIVMWKVYPIISENMNVISNYRYILINRLIVCIHHYNLLKICLILLRKNEVMSMDTN